MYGVVKIWLIIVNFLLDTECGENLKGIAKFPLLKEQNAPLELQFIESYLPPYRVRLKPSFLINFEWRIHMLPVQMGLGSCDHSTIGDCFECPVVTKPPENNNPQETVYKCLSGKFNQQSTINNQPIYEFPSCAKLSGQNGLIGRSVVVKVEDKRGKSTSTSSESVFCATIFKAGEDEDQFSSTIAWFQEPYAGFIAFRQRSDIQSYIIVNMTRVTKWKLKDEKLQWRIEMDITANELKDKESKNANECIYNPSSDKYNCIFNPYRKRLNSDVYSTDCTESNQYGCAQGDLTKKHNLLTLDNSKTNLLLYVDASLMVDLLLEKRLVLYKLYNNNSRELIASAMIENIQTIFVNIPFMDGSSLKLVQRDPWSLVMYSYNSMDKNPQENIWSWRFTIHKVPTLHICSGELWNCNMWSNIEHEPGSEFKTMPYEAPLGQKYTLYGRNSIMYHGVIMQNPYKRFCSTITYKQEEELIGYSKLENVIDQSGQRAVVILIQHTTLRQTTFLIASKCKEYSMPLYLSLSNGSCRSSEVYNPHNVCPALCSERSCGNSCGKLCCTNCAPHSSSLCPIGDLRSRFGTFNQVTIPPRSGIYLELVFTVMNDLDLPLADMIDKKLGLKIAQKFDPDMLVRCGDVRRLRQTQVKVQLAGGAELTLSQNATWQPLTISWTLVSKISLTFWKTPGFDKSVCKHTPEKLDTIPSDDLKFSPMTLPLYSSTGRRSFFGPNSVLGCSLSIEYTGASGVETTTVDLLPKDVTDDVQAVLIGDDGTYQIQFDLMQRVDHLTEETYITVTILNAALCTTQINYKWYIIKNTIILKKGDLFEVKDEKDTRFFGSDQVDCAYGSFKSGDLSGKLDDLKFSGPGKVYRDPYIPVKSVVGHYLLLAHQNNSVVASLVLQRVPKREEQVPTPAPQQSNVYVIAAVAVAVIVVVVVVFLCCCLYIHRQTRWCGLKQSERPIPQGYDPVGQIPKPIEPQYHGYYKIRRPNGELWGPVKVVSCENKYISLLKVQHMHTTEIENANADMLIEIPKDELDIQNAGYIKKRPPQIHAGSIVTNGAQGYVREPRVIIKKPKDNHQYAEENLYSQLPGNGIPNLLEPTYTDYRFRRTTQSTRSDSSLSGASVSS